VNVLRQGAMFEESGVVEPPPSGGRL